MDPRVKKCVRDVNHQVCKHVDEREHECETLHDEEVPPDDRLQRVLADAIEVVDRFYDYGAADEGADLQTDERHDWNQSILESVAPYDRALSQSL